MSTDPQYKNVLPQRKPAGHLLLDDKVVADTLQCCHCGVHWVPRKGSGIRRGFCLNCKSPVCGKNECIDSCVPMEMRLELYEAGKINRL